ncbi:MAG: DUF4197 domain-containing protein [Phaeodactylibacter sp.]|nr:DUF4197 domain-containing protein [Phaeodactylibacter sp.]
MLKKIAALIMITSLMAACTTQQIQSTLDTLAGAQGLTTTEVAGGLKQALEFGIGEGAQRLSQENGYFKSPYKILLPPEARKITNKLQNVPGFRAVEETILEKINRGAEDAAKKAKPIFVNAIKQMTFSDAMDILMGQDDAATQYLHRTTFDALYNEFNPVIIESLDKFNARDYWADAVNTYNSIPLVEKANPDLDDYVTQEALKGLFAMVEKKERSIRTDVSARTTDLLRKVFAKQDNK